MSEEEHFLFCEAASGKPTRRDEIGKVSTAAGILIHYRLSSSWSKLKCPFLDYDSREHDQLLQFVSPSFLKENQLKRERKRAAKTP